MEEKLSNRQTTPRRISKPFLQGEKPHEDRTEKWISDKRHWKPLISLQELKVGDLVRIYLSSLAGYMQDYHGFEFHRVDKHGKAQDGASEYSTQVRPISWVSEAIH